MSDPRTFYMQQFFGALSTETIQALASDGGYMGMAEKYAKLHAQNSRLAAVIREQRKDLEQVKQVVTA